MFGCHRLGISQLCRCGRSWAGPPEKPATSNIGVLAKLHTGERSVVETRVLSAILRCAEWRSRGAIRNIEVAPTGKVTMSSDHLFFVRANKSQNT